MNNFVAIIVIIFVTAAFPSSKLGEREGNCLWESLGMKGCVSPGDNAPAC